MGLKAQVLSGVKWTSAASLWTAGIQVAQLAILARLVSKEDFGLFAIIVVIQGFSTLFIEAGLSSAIIHRQNASRDELANAYVINIVLGSLVFIFIYILAHPISLFYDNSRLVDLVRLSSITFIIAPWGMQYLALFQRDLRLEFLAKVEVISVTLGAVIAVLLAYNGFGVYALIYSQITIGVCRTLLVLLVGIKVFGFKLKFNWQKARYYLRFGAFQIGERTINYFNTQIDVLIIGKLLGQEVLGGYYIAKEFVFRPLLLINPIVNKVALPSFAKIQNDQERLKHGYLSIISMISFTQLAVYLLIAGFSDEITTVLLGSGWQEVAVLISILSFYVVQRAIGSPIGNLMLAKGKVELGFYWNLTLFFIFPFVVWFSSKWGVEGVAWGLGIFMLVLQLPGWYFFVNKLCGASYVEYFGEILRPLTWALLCFGPLVFFDQIFLKILYATFGVVVYIYVNWWRFKLLNIGSS